MLDTGMVTFLVEADEEQREFKVHKKFVAQCQVFGRIFEGGSQEGITQIAILPEENANAFVHFLSWLYGTKLDHIAPDPVNLELYLFFFAEKYGVIRFMDNLMDSIVAYQRGRGMVYGGPSSIRI